MSDRTQKLAAAIRPEKYPICTERLRLMTASYRETEGQPQVVRAALALAHMLENISIFIEEGELIAGNVASKPMGLEIQPTGGRWTREELEGLEAEGFLVSEEDKVRVEELNAYWKGRTPQSRAAQLYDDEKLWPYAQSGVVLPKWQRRDAEPIVGTASGGMGLGGGLIVVDYAIVLNGGLETLIAQAEHQLATIEFGTAGSVKKAQFWQSVIIAHRAIIRFANRFANLAVEMADREHDPVRKKELERIAATCRQVPAFPARDFYEALQSFWFVFLMLNPSGTLGLGRFDQYMFPFYKGDKEAGRITEAEALELLVCLRIKDMQLNRTFARAQRAKWSGLAKWHNMVIGGTTTDGQDATNDLTYLVLEAALCCQTPHHTITVRVHQGTPDTLLQRALQVVKTGIGMPALVSDESYVRYLVSQHVPLELARDYALAGCLDAVIPGRSRIGPLQLFIVPLVFDFFMHNGVEPKTGRQLGPQTGTLESFKTFDELLAAFKEHLAYFIRLQIACDNIAVQVSNDVSPNPVVASLMTDGIEQGKNIFERTYPFENGIGLNPVGMVNIVDSLAAIKKLVFEEGRFTLKQLYDALQANWQGYEQMRTEFLAAPKFGNDDDYADALARELYRFWADTLSGMTTCLGGTVKPAGISITAHAPGGALTGATPDGRKVGEILADGTMSPAQGRDARGPIASLKSAAKIEQSAYQSTLLNMKFHPSSLRTPEDLSKLAALVRTYFDMGGKHIQFNVVNRQTLLDAQEHPENHRNLVVRMAGYSAYFVQLNRVTQDDIIARTEHETVN